ncbi:hypothetical protein MCOR14_004894 [Pyricularia oryzae]|nr:hypothetical protein MCOR01_001718 [Pyricularia oryzae]KAI6402042.1 hypothetical protein MCOR24_008401 [Pyricularia oryzae]KAI6409416.1 hypothetical protein MCOR20_005011 [Pyricularia oryzae]KAI6530646.1 hypothetical protein MCOR05_007659 [Pyricularia oryzae]KAI6578457.1 hypothetical protein MCOR04_006406 [Pyricularia oryzae]
MFVGTNSNRVIPPDNSLTMASVMAHGFERLLAKGKISSMRKQKIPSKSPVFASFHESSASSSSSESAYALADEQSLFPAPSFIRPTTSRMLARDEKSPSCKRLNDALDAKRSPRSPRRFSASESHSSGASSIRSSVRSSTRSSTPRIPRRSSSLVAQQREEHPSLASLLHYEFTEGESKNAKRSLNTLCAPASPIDSECLALLEKFPSIDDNPPTPPPKDDYRLHLSQVGNYPTSPRTLSPSVSHPLPLQAAAQPRLRPSLSSRSAPDLAARSSGQQSPTGSLIGRHRFANLRIENPKPLRISHNRSRSSDIVLQEPAVGDFLGLSDDDIAEERPPTPPVLSTSAVPTTPLVPQSETTQQPVPPPKSPSRSLRKLSVDSGPPTPPPLALAPTPLSVKRISARLSMGTTEDRAAAMAAFEVARIASRYSFDLIYIIDMWPKQMLRRKPSAATRDPFGTGLASPRRTGSVRTSKKHTRTSSNHSSTFSEAHDDTNPDRYENTGLDYRFLAAYGLHTVKPPLEIAYSVHSKILKHEGWIEYRQPERNDSEFARGYACSFYTGCAPTESHHSRNSSLASTSEASTEESGATSPRLDKGKPIARSRSGTNRSDHNRGIVFAAYRKRQLDGEAPGLSREELRGMQLDAETLVNMIVDCHKVKRRSEQQTKGEPRPRRPSAAQAPAETALGEH